MTHQNVPLNIRLNNPGALRAYWGQDYNDGYERGLAKFRTPGDGWRALIKRIQQIYGPLKKRTWKDFICELVHLSENDPLYYARALQTIMHREDEDMARADIRAASTVEIFNLAMAISIVESGRPPSAWPTGKWWIDLHDLIAFHNDEGAA